MIYSLVRFVVDGTYPSLNQYYAGKHWAVRKKDKDRWVEFFLERMEIANLPEFTQYEIVIEFNNRKDVDNVIPISKFFNDALRKGGYIPDDSTKYWRDLCIHYTPDLEKNRTIINLYYKPLI